MNKKFTFAALLLLLALLVQSVVLPPQPAAASCSDAAQFIADVTVLDGTIYKVGDNFTKTWRLRNAGSCTWTPAYSLVFNSGNQMNAPASVSFPNQNTAPGQTIDLSVAMTAPNVSGAVYSYWKLKNANGGTFGIGFNADRAFWVQIQVSTSGGGTNYDFAKNVAAAVWTNGTGAGQFLENPRLEDGTTFNGLGIEMVPGNSSGSFIQAEYPVIHVQSGDHFQSIVNCEYLATGCYVRFSLNYKTGSDPTVRTFWTFREAYDGLYYRANLDLGALAGQDIKFILRVDTLGSPASARALWAGPRLTNAGIITTPVPPITGTPPTPTNTPVYSSNGDRATFVDDISVPDGNVYGPNTSFTKLWRIKNTGTTTWTTSFKLVFVNGDQMSAPSEVPFVSTVPPNASVTLPGVGMVSPGTNGSYKGFWMLKNATGALFGIGPFANKPFWVQIVVINGNNFTATPTVSGTPPTASALTSTPTPNNGSDRAQFVMDVTIPDDTAFAPNVPFVKTWRLQNVGTSTWTSSYKLVFVSGDQMGTTGEFTLPGNTSPGNTVDISASLTSPSVKGTYRGYWMLKNASGQLFGIGFTANKPFWVDISVTNTAPSATPTLTLVPGTITASPTPTKSPTPGTSTATVTATSVSGCDRLSVTKDVTIPDGDVRNANTPFTKTWRLMNMGSCTWTTDYKLVFVSGDQMGGPPAINLPSSVAPNATIDISVSLIAPTTNGNHRGYWELKNASGGLFGFGLNADTAFWVDINVVQSGGSGFTATPTRTLTVSPMPTATSTPSLTPTAPSTSSATPTVSPTPSLTPTPTSTP